MSLPLDAYRVIPYAKLTPDGCLQVAERGESALAALASARIGRGLRTRLRDAIGVLRHVAASGSFGENDPQLLRTIDAIALTVDFFQIAQCLGREVPSVVTAELSAAICGAVEGTLKNRQAVEFQAQYWVGMLLSSARLEPRVPHPSLAGTKPDFIVDVGSFDLAVEVKRPQSANSMVHALDRAAGQLRGFGKPGFIFVDISDCLASREDRVHALGHRTSLAAEKQLEFFRLGRALEARAPNYKRSDKYHRIIGIMPYARIVEWRFEPDPTPAGQVFVLPVFYPNACAGLLRHELPRVRRLLLGALEVVNGSSPIRAS